MNHNIFAILYYLKNPTAFHYFQSLLMLLTFKTHVQRMILLCAVNANISWYRICVFM